MKLKKDGTVIELNNEGHIAAFMSSGWTEAKQEPKKEEEEEILEKKPDLSIKAPKKKV